MTIFKKILLLATISLGIVSATEARAPIAYKPAPANGADYRGVCSKASSRRDLSINNVRCALWNGGDMFWDHKGEGIYIVPKIAPGSTQKEVSSLFCAAIWIGGYDASNNLVMAAQTYGYSTGKADYYPGPLNPASINNSQIPVTTSGSCSSWDKQFEVSGVAIEKFKSLYYKDNTDPSDDGIVCEPGDPLFAKYMTELKKWPGRGNKYISTYYGFQVPAQEMAPFFDNPNGANGGDGFYNPCDGDFPIIEVRGCDAGNNYQKAQYGDQMYWWVYNDDGASAPHGESGGATIKMEVQAQAFAYQTDNQINNMTFYRYKLLNRRPAALKDTYMALWSDPDLGCAKDDYIGCRNDTTKVLPNGSVVTRGLGYVYNADADDEVVCNYQGSTSNGYGSSIPMLGVDYFRGPLDENGNELGMSSFVYYINRGSNPGPGMDDPSTGPEFYNYLSGYWKDGQPFIPCANGRSGPCAPGPPFTKFVFTDDPANSTGWSQAAQNVTPADMRFIHSTGPFKLNPGATNEIISGVVWVPNQIYPKPRLDDLLDADDVAQNLFDGCFDILDGPDAPDLNLIELDKEIIITLKAAGNNAGEKYEEVDPAIPASVLTNNKYKFEGYRVYQLADVNVGGADLEDPEKAREIFTVDLKNGISTIRNWSDAGAANPGYPVPTIKISKSPDNGILHSFRFVVDQFPPKNTGSSTGKLINHHKYYFKAVAYAYNNYEDYSPANKTGQSKPYFQGRRGVNTTYSAIPRRVEAETLGSVINAHYGDAPALTRVDGKGNAGLFLDLDDYTVSGDAGTYISQTGNLSKELRYKAGFGPADIKVVDPLSVQGGQFILSVGKDATGVTNTTAATLDNSYWELKSVTDASKRWVGESPISNGSDQIIADLGISVRLLQAAAPGTASGLSSGNGYIGADVTYKDPAYAWFEGVKPSDPRFNFGGILDFIKTGLGQPDNPKDPKQVYSAVLNGSFYPYTLCNCREGDAGRYVTPAWIPKTPATFCETLQNLNKIDQLNNVDIVMTPDRSKWSRCVVLETTNAFYTSTTGLSTEGNALNMTLRQHKSVNISGDTLGETTSGRGWFPGYAVDVETGQRLNIFFGESSLYNNQTIVVNPALPGIIGNVTTGGDMLFNPSTSALHGETFNPQNPTILALGGMHSVYVMRTAYDSCNAVYTGLLNNSLSQRRDVFKQISWTSIVLPKIAFTSVAQGLIPTETTVKLRVNSSYKKDQGTGVNDAFPQYKFDMRGFAPTQPTATTQATVMDEIKVVPNPYYAYAGGDLYETSDNSTAVRFVNLPPECEITIYSLDGKVIRHYNRDETSSRTAYTKQKDPSFAWDLKNSKQVLISSGVYLIHFKSPTYGERVIKWFGITREIDGQRL